MWTMFPIESAAGAMELVCYLFTIAGSLLSCLCMLRA